MQQDPDADLHRQLTFDEMLGFPPLPPPPKGSPDHGTRRPLPEKRRGTTFEATVGGTKVYVSTGEYEDGSLGEIFVDISKEGSTIRGLVTCFATAFSLALQHGVPLHQLCETYMHSRFDPAGLVQGHPKIGWATSIPDYIAKLLAVEYLGWEGLQGNPAEFPEG